MRLLDLFCGAGGAAMGYHRAGFDEIVGVDNKPQKRYPFEFVQADALEYCREHGGEFDVIHASPPCQAYTPLRARHPGKDYPNLLSVTRRELMRAGVPWVIENVPGAPMRVDVMLCGGMFGLRTYRHRWFETSLFVGQPEHPPHKVRTSTKKRHKCFAAGLHISVTGDVGSYVGPLCMGIDWMTGKELSQAIPPAYTEYVGCQLLERLGGKQETQMATKPAKDGSGKGQGQPGGGRRSRNRRPCKGSGPGHGQGGGRGKGKNRSDN